MGFIQHTWWGGDYRRKISRGSRAPKADDRHCSNPVWNNQSNLNQMLRMFFVKFSNLRPTQKCLKRECWSDPNSRLFGHLNNNKCFILVFFPTWHNHPTSFLIATTFLAQSSVKRRVSPWKHALHLENYPAVISMWTVCVECRLILQTTTRFSLDLGGFHHQNDFSMKKPDGILLQLFTCFSGLRFFCFVSFFQQLNKKSFSNEVNEMGRKLVEKVTHTHSPIVTTTSKKKKKNPPIQLWKWGFGTFGTSLLRVCLPHPACLCHREKESPNLDAEEKKTSSSTLVFLSLWIARGISRFFPWLLLPHFPFVNSICIPFGDRKCLRFWYVCPRGELGGGGGTLFRWIFFLCIHGCIKVSFSLYVYHPGLLLLLSTKKKITNDETKEDRLLSL